MNNRYSELSTDARAQIDRLVNACASYPESSLSMINAALVAAREALKGSRLTKQESAELLLGHNSFDCALPQGWLSYWAGEDYDIVRSGTVWNYPTGSLFGQPFALTNGAAQLIESRS